MCCNDETYEDEEVIVSSFRVHGPQMVRSISQENSSTQRDSHAGIIKGQCTGRFILRFTINEISCLPVEGWTVCRNPPVQKTHGWKNCRPTNPVTENNLRKGASPRKSASGKMRVQVQIVVFPARRRGRSSRAVPRQWSSGIGSGPIDQGPCPRLRRSPKTRKCHIMMQSDMIL